MFNIPRMKQTSQAAGHHHQTSCPICQYLVVQLHLPDWQLPQMFTAESGEKLLRVGPSTLTSSKSLRLEQFRLALLSFFIIFSIEKNLHSQLWLLRMAR